LDDQGLKPKPVSALKRRAARLGRSAEAEHQEILREALAGELTCPSFKRFLRENLVTACATSLSLRGD
jgi:plasmid stability protein